MGDIVSEEVKKIKTATSVMIMKYIQHTILRRMHKQQMKTWVVELKVSLYIREENDVDKIHSASIN